MSMKTPMEIAQDTLRGRDATGERLPESEVLSIAVAAIEADRKQRERETIARKVWILEDFEGYWDTHYSGVYSLSPEQTRKIIESAPNYLYRAALEDCTDAEWDAIDEAFRSSIRAELGE